MGVTPSENFWTLWRPSQGVTPVTFCSKNIIFSNFWGVTGITTCDGRHTPSDGRHTLITKINQSNEKYYCMTGDMPFEVFQWSMNGWIEWTWDWILSELFRLQVIFLKTILHQQQQLILDSLTQHKVWYWQVKVVM